MVKSDTTTCSVGCQECWGIVKLPETHTNEVVSFSAAAISFSSWLLRSVLKNKKTVFLLAQELIFKTNPPLPLPFLSDISLYLCVNILSIALGLAYSFNSGSTLQFFYTIVFCAVNTITSEPASTVFEVQFNPQIWPQGLGGRYWLFLLRFLYIGNF